MHIHTLPVETLLQIIGYLPIQTICTLESVSQTFHKLVKRNLNAIYQVAARLHQFAPQNALTCGPQAALKAAVATLGPNKWLHEIRDWKQFCKSSFLLEQAWSFSCRGSQPIYRRMETPDVYRIRRDEDFKVDEVEQTVIIRRDTGDLEVVLIETGEQVWKIRVAAPPPPVQAAPPPFLEFGKGFLIFSRKGSNLIDVWRRSADCYHPHSYLPSRPTNDQLARSPDAATAFSSGYLPIDGSSNERTSPLTTCTLRTSIQLPRRGVFLPFTQIAYKPRFSKYSYAHPYLAALRDSFPRQGLSVVDIWHLPTLQRSARLCIDRDIGPVADIAVSLTYLYVAASQRIVAYKWISTIPDESGEPVFLPAYPQFVLPRPHTNQLPTFLCERINRDDVQGSSDNITCPANMVPVTSFALPTDVQRINLEDERNWRLAYQFSSVAISPDGSDLVAIAGSHLVVYLPNFPNRGSANSKPNTKKGRIAFAFGIGKKAADIPKLKKLSTVTETIKHVAFDGHRILLCSPKGVFAVVVKDRRCLEAAHQSQPTPLPHPKPPFTICGVERPHFLFARPGTCANLLNGSAWFTMAYIHFNDFGGVDVSGGANDSGMDEDGASGRVSAGGI
ncbi:hypothetical protein M407DRAFT_21886 [Tulasnella calospora MUT 4182]|uniref:F-box domain-containing protein n=1 Tax=Tulasnella calospora MUT 4182 TaxID=1051891 RepID=A0A0C3QMD4_9AGAM|nr:hypothetical protein M407DRAFT_21886 [Tulasnella calospora MUT 4182]